LAISEPDRQSTAPEDIRKCLSAGVLPACYEISGIEVEVQNQQQTSCFVRQENDTVICPITWIVACNKKHRKTAQTPVIPMFSVPENSLFGQNVAKVL
jgi:hypothetical protein